MVITYHTAECFKISFGDMTIACNPVSKDSTLKAPKFGADIVLTSLNHPDMNGVEQMVYGDKEPFVVRGPGEYEVRGVLIKGFPTKSTYDRGSSHHSPSDGMTNTVYFFTLEGMKLCFLGALGESALSSDLKEQTDDIDVLFVPIGGEGVLAPDDAHDLVVTLEPRIVIPMHYGNIGMENALPLFLKEAGIDGVAPIDKLTIKRKDLETREGDIVILQS